MTPTQNELDTTNAVLSELTKNFREKRQHSTEPSRSCLMEIIASLIVTRAVLPQTVDDWKRDWPDEVKWSCTDEIKPTDIPTTPPTRDAESGADAAASAGVTPGDPSPASDRSNGTSSPPDQPPGTSTA